MKSTKKEVTSGYETVQKHVMVLNLGMILGLAARAEGIVKDAKKFATATTCGC